MLLYYGNAALDTAYATAAVMLAANPGVLNSNLTVLAAARRFAVGLIAYSSKGCHSLQTAVVGCRQGSAHASSNHWTRFRSARSTAGMHLS